MTKEEIMHVLKWSMPTTYTESEISNIAELYIKEHNKYHQSKLKNIGVLGNVSESLNKQNACNWYLKGFRDAERTKSQPVSIEQTMKDAESHFELVWDYNKSNSR
jgi:hypothetical protein